MIRVCAVLGFLTLTPILQLELLQLFFLIVANRPPVSRAAPRAAAGGGGGGAAQAAQIEELNTQLMESKLTIEGLEKERDFYFGKLRDIEVLAQENETDEIVQKILGVLYATEVSLHFFICLITNQ